MRGPGLRQTEALASARALGKRPRTAGIDDCGAVMNGMNAPRQGSLERAQSANRTSFGEFRFRTPTTLLGSGSYWMRYSADESAPEEMGRSWATPTPFAAHGFSSRVNSS